MSALIHLAMFYDRYTYGKPVPGHMTMRVCRKYSNPSNCHSGESQAICEKFSHQVGGKLFLLGTNNGDIVDNQ